MGRSTENYRSIGYPSSIDLVLWHQNDRCLGSARDSAARLAYKASASEIETCDPYSSAPGSQQC